MVKVVMRVGLNRRVALVLVTFFAAAAFVVAFSILAFLRHDPVGQIFPRSVESAQRTAAS